jgi:hypothetical protein
LAVEVDRREKRRPHGRKRVGPEPRAGRQSRERPAKLKTGNTLRTSEGSDSDEPFVKVASGRGCEGIFPGQKRENLEEGKLKRGSDGGAG